MAYAHPSEATHTEDKVNTSGLILQKGKPPVWKDPQGDAGVTPQGKLLRNHNYWNKGRYKIKEKQLLN